MRIKVQSRRDSPRILNVHLQVVLHSKRERSLHVLHRGRIHPNRRHPPLTTRVRLRVIDVAPRGRVELPVVRHGPARLVCNPEQALVAGLRVRAQPRIIVGVVAVVARRDDVENGLAQVGRQRVPCGLGRPAGITRGAFATGRLSSEQRGRCNTGGEQREGGKKHPSEAAVD